MQTRNRVFDDFARVASGAASSVTGLKAELESLIRAQLERLMGDQALVSRDEFDAVQAMAAKARAEQEALHARVAALEAALGTTGKAGEKPGKTAKSGGKPKPRAKTKPKT